MCTVSGEANLQLPWLTLCKRCMSNHTSTRKVQIQASQSELGEKKVVITHTKRTRDVSVMRKRKKHYGESEGGIRVTHLGVEKPPGKSQVEMGHHYCLGQHFLSMWQIQWWMEQLLLISTKLQHLQCLSQCHIQTATQNHTQTDIETHKSTNTHLHLTCLKVSTHTLSQ